jgi:hypothetical protein
MKRDEICWHSRDYCRDTISRGRMKMNMLTITLRRDREQDLLKMELAKCWADSSMGATESIGRDLRGYGWRCRSTLRRTGSWGEMEKIYKVDAALVDWIGLSHPH